MLDNTKIQDEIHVKLGDDQGSGSFKMSYQIANTLRPNSKNNTVIQHI